MHKKSITLFIAHVNLLKNVPAIPNLLCSLHVAKLGMAENVRGSPDFPKISGGVKIKSNAFFLVK